MTKEMGNIDYTKLPREKVYRDRVSISDFDAEKRNTLNWWLIQYVYDSRIIELEDAETHILRIFNTANYLATVLHTLRNPMMKYGWFLKTVTELGAKEDANAGLFVAATMGMLVNYIRVFYDDDNGDRTEGELLIDRIYTWIVDNYGRQSDESKLFSQFYLLPGDPINSARKRMSSNDFMPLNIESEEDTVNAIEDTESNKNSALIKDLEERLKAAAESNKELTKEADGLRLRLKSTDADVTKWQSMYNEAEETKKKLETENHLLREMLSQQKKEIVEKKAETAFNAATGSSCFTSRQMGILLTAIALMTEDPVPGKTTLGEVVEKICGYKATTVNQNVKGSFRDADKEVVAKAIESKFPKLAAKIRKI